MPMKSTYHCLNTWDNFFFRPMIYILSLVMKKCTIKTAKVICFFCFDIPIQSLWATLPLQESWSEPQDLYIRPTKCFSQPLSCLVQTDLPILSAISLLCLSLFLLHLHFSLCFTSPTSSPFIQLSEIWLIKKLKNNSPLTFLDIGM